MARRAFHNLHTEKNIFQLRLVGVTLLLVCLALGAFSVYKYFRVVKISCVQDGTECPQDTMETISHLRDRSLFEDFSVNMLGKKIRIRKKYPQTLLVEIENLDSITSLYLDRDKMKRAILYTDGSIHNVPADNLSTSSATVAITDLTLSALTDSTVLSSSKFAVYTDLLGFAKSTNIEEIVIVSPDEIEIHTQGKLTALVSSDSLKQQLHSLQLLLASPTIEQKPARVDMRFDRPVLQYY